MFGQNKPTGFAGFGTTTSFGGFGQSSSTFGSTGSAFGSQTPGGGTSLFGASGTTGGAGTGLFGQSSGTGFGQQQGTGAFSFGSATGSSTPGGLFGGASQTGTGSSSLFSTPSTATGFGAAKTGFSGFGSTPSQTSTGGLFGTNPGATPSLFSGATSAFGSVGGGTTIAFNPPSGQDTMMKSGITTNISTRHQCITAMKEYENKSLEELRFEDYNANRKAKQAGAPSTGSLFGQAQPTQPAASTGFVFGSGLTTGLQQSSTTGFGAFGSTNSSSAASTFSTNRPLFGTTTTTQSGFGFGSATGTQSTSLFGGAATRPLFGTTTQPSLTGSFFGSSAASAASNPVGFGTSTQSGGLFGASKPTGFGTATTSTIGFGTGTNLFAKPASTASTFGFGTNTSTTGFGATSGGLFSMKPNTGFGTATTGSLGLTGSSFGFGSGLSTSSTASTFGSTQAKPFGGFNFSSGPSIGSTGFGNTLGTGNTAGTFNIGGATTTLGTSVPATSQAPNSPHLLALASSPYGDNPLFWNLKQQSKERREDALKPTNPNAQKAVLSSANQYKVSTRPTAKIKPKSLHSLIAGGKTQLFEGLEDDEFSFGEDTFVPRKSVKKLVIRKSGSKSSDMSSSLHSDAAGDYCSQVKDLSNNKSLPPPITRPLNMSQNDNTLDNEAEALQVHKTPPPVRQITDSQNTSLDDSIVTNLGGGNNNRLSAADTTTSFLNTSDLDASCLPVDRSTPHPTGVTLTRPGYFTIPSLDEMMSYLDENGDCVVDNFTVGREGYGTIFFPGETNVAGMNLDEIIHFRRKEVVVYPDDDKKPPLGQGLNKKAEITLDFVWPTDRSTRKPINSPERLKMINYAHKLEETTAKLGAKFIDYRPETGSWVFQVYHFSKYGLLDDSDEDELTEQQKELLAQSAKDFLMVQKMKIQQINLDPKEKAKKLSAPCDQPQQFQVEDQIMLQGEEELSADDDSFEMQDSFLASSKKYDKDFQEDEGTDVGIDSKFLASSMGVSAKTIQGMKASFFGDLDEKKSGRRDIELDEEKDLRFSLKKSGDKMAAGLFGAFKYPATLSLPQSPALSDQQSKNGYEPVAFGKSGLFDVSLGKDLLRPKPQTFLQTPHVEHKLINSGMQSQDAPPRIVGTLVRHNTLHVKDSVLYNNQQPFVDAAFFMGRSFRVGWGLPWTLVHSGALIGIPEEDTQEVSLLPFAKGRAKTQPSTKSWMAHVEQVQVTDYMDTRDSKILSQQEALLTIQLEHSRFNMEDGCPVFVPEPGVAALHKIADLVRNGIADMSAHPDIKAQEHFKMVLSLCVALWGNLLEDADLDKEDVYRETQLRREMLSRWLTETGFPKVLEEMEAAQGKEGYLEKVFSKLTIGEISKACELAQAGRDHRLALLLSQAMGSMVTRHMLAVQLAQWAEQNTCQFISKLRLKIYCLLAGQLVWRPGSSEGDSTEDINTCHGLDWKRSLALHLWFKSPPNGTIQHALRQYQQGFESNENRRPYCARPLPPYLEEEEENDDSIFDTAYHLLCLYADKSYGLEALLSPTSSTPSHLDFRLSWHLLQVLQSLQYCHLSPYHTESIHVSFASQLEALGLWHWAAFVLLHIRDTGHRQQAVMSLLQRHIQLGDSLDERETFLVNELHIPSEWLHQAKAIRAHLEGNYATEAKHWILAGHYSRGHSLILQHLASDAIINDEDMFLKSYLEQLAPPERSLSILNWSTSGKVFLDFINIRQRIDQLKQSEPTAYDLEELEPDVLCLCNRVKNLPCYNAKDRLCQAEMSKTIANLLRTLVFLCGESPVQLLTKCIADLPMPEDYMRQELQALTSAYLLEIV
ncbi:nuclear pore complex protein Nup98-Nup96-like isoform X2 [Biomphalaria glabrata]|uniref:Nuclear pore complex protein Nup98-Nup96 n=1 Tax=Biomphalaria glabrata TaxID=6526 RepID=A0A9W3B144_BIOGL|nr:nuclear pore complex protein Nup98-Nup96-like isoform X2 [Biomphalaria glabrata]KAI8733993.1 nuclear pore complex protein Nup98-Nup96-like [Biomphalaria glabrata]